jgi:hypothetical protein
MATDVPIDQERFGATDVCLNQERYGYHPFKTYYYAYSCGSYDGAAGMADYIEGVCGHAHLTPTEAAACVTNFCMGGVRACDGNGIGRQLNEKEIEGIPQYAHLKR